MKKIIVVLIVVIIAVVTACVIVLNNPKISKNPVQTSNSNKSTVVAPIEETQELIEKTDETQEIAKEQESQMNENSTSVGDFDFEFLKLENKGENMIYSPLSIKTAMLMLNEGATGETKAQVEKLLGNYKGKSYPSSKNISFANALFIRDTFKDFVLSSYGDTLKSKYGAEVFIDEFASAKKANDWIEKETLGIIKNTLKDEQVTKEDVVMMIINALGIDMEWKEQYDAEMTRETRFLKENKTYKDQNGIVPKYNLDEEIVYEVPTLSNSYTINTYSSDSKFADWGYTSKTDFQYYVDEDVTVFAKELNEYDGVDLQFIAIKPEDTPLQEYVNSFNANTYNGLLAKMKKISKENHNPNKFITVFTELPKFNFDYDLKLKNDLLELGMINAFDREKAEFYNIIDESGDAFLFVGDAIHKANIDLSEEGIKAAAVTIFLMEGGGEGDEDVPEFEEIYVLIDKPFLFIIRDVNTGDIWFTGTVYKPTLWKDVKDQYEPKSWDEYNQNN